MDGDRAYRGRLQRRRNATDDFVRVAARAREHPPHALLGRRDHGKAVGPYLLEEKFERVYCIGHVRSSYPAVSIAFETLRLCPPAVGRNIDLRPAPPPTMTMRAAASRTMASSESSS